MEAMFLLSLISKIRFIEKNRIKVLVNGLYYCICFNLITTKLLIYPLIKNMHARVTELLIFFAFCIQRNKIRTENY